MTGRQAEVERKGIPSGVNSSSRTHGVGGEGGTSVRHSGQESMVTVSSEGGVSSRGHCSWWPLKVDMTARLQGRIMIKWERKEGGSRKEN